MKNLPADLIERLKQEYPLNSLKVKRRLEDEGDQTVKYLFELKDNEVVETVLMKYKYGYSVCISSQVGCKMGCTFCASTLGGLIRQLSPSEMLDQIYAIEYELKVAIHSVVVMGTGEPLDNYDNFVRFVELLSDEKGRNLSRRNITVSTCGILDKIDALSYDLPQINLAISLHSPNQNMRKAVMPVSIKYPLEALIDTCKTYVLRTHRRITFEYSLIKGVNDHKEHAQELVRLLSGFLCHVNLIPVNPVDEKSHEASEQEDVRRFKDVLEKGHIQVTVRRSLGQNIDAACGQLRNRYIENQ
jgi:23S rRNA (adenine2503-C2)-methyltransferase